MSMKNFSFALSLVILVTAGYSWSSLNADVKNEKKSFIISGTINGFHAGKIILNYQRAGNIIEVTGLVKDGKFRLTGQVPEVQQVTLSFSNQNFNASISFFAGNEKINVTVDTASISQPVIEGSASQAEYESYRTLVAGIDKKSEELNKTGRQLYLSGKLTDDSRDSLFKVHDELDDKKRTLIVGFAKDHPASAVSAWAISVFFGYETTIRNWTSCNWPLTLYQQVTRSACMVNRSKRNY